MVATGAPRERGAASPGNVLLITCALYRHKDRFIIRYQVQFCVTIARLRGRERNVNVAAVARRQRSRTEALEREVAWLIPGDGKARDGESRQAHIR